MRYFNFGTHLEDPRVLQAFQLYLRSLPELDQKRIIKNLRKTSKTLKDEFTPKKINILNNLNF